MAENSNQEEAAKPEAAAAQTQQPVQVQVLGVPKDPIQVKQRIIVNFYTAKRLLAALQMSVARHESVFGVLETDINKRVRPGLTQQASAEKKS